MVEYPSNDIVVFRLNRPQVRNALSLELRIRLTDKITRHADDPKIRCLVMTGPEKVFAASADIGEMAGRCHAKQQFLVTRGSPNSVTRSAPSSREPHRQ